MTSTTPFVVFALPRSRTAWLSKFLSYGEWTCHHDASLEFDSVADLAKMLSTPHTGLADTAMALLWRDVVGIAPGAKLMVVRRKRSEVAKSLERIGVRANPRTLVALEDALGEIAAQTNALVVTFDQLDSPAVCKAVFEHCLGLEFDFDWWAWLAGKNIQVDVGEHLAKATFHRKSFERLYAPALARYAG